MNCLHEKPWSFHHCKPEPSSSPDHRVQSGYGLLSDTDGALTSPGAFSSGCARDTWCILVLFLPVLGTLSSGLALAPGRGELAAVLGM